jgi:hypothetical protein
VALPLRKNDAQEAVSATASGQLFRAPVVAKLPVKKPKLPITPRLSEDVSAAVRKKTATIGDDRYPMPDKKHARLALQMINRGDLSPEEKAKVRARANKMLGEADRGADGKFHNDSHTTAAREHLLAASIAVSSGDTQEAQRRMDSAEIHTSHSQHAKAPDALKKIAAAKSNLTEPVAAQGHLQGAYDDLQGEPNRLLMMKKTRESDTGRTFIRETLTFHPKFIESTFDPEKGTVDVIIIDEGQGNSRDKNNYLGKTISEAVNRGVFDGEQAYADHPSKFDDNNRPERSIRDLIGYYYNSRETKTDNGVAYGATLKIQEGQDWVVGLIKEAINFQKKFPDKQYVGISINADGDTVPTQRNGKTVNDVVRITEAFSADIVTKPARGGKFLKLVENTNGSKGDGMDHTKILEAAKKLESIAAGEAVDPADLTAIAATMREETASGKDTKANVGTAQMEAAKNPKDGEDDADENPDEFTEADKAAFMQWKKESAKREADKVKVGTAQMEAAATTSTGNLTESQKLAKAHPTVWAAALSEAQALAKTGTVKLEDVLAENAAFKAQNLIRESMDIAKKKLSESKLPEGAFADILPQLIGLDEPEIVAVISAKEKFIESLGFDMTKRVAGTGAKLPLREAADTAGLTNELLVGVVQD